MSNSDAIKELEKIVDGCLLRNRLYGFPFGTILGAIGYLAGYQYYKNKTVEPELLAPLPFIFDKNIDFSPQRAQKVWESLRQVTEDENFREDFKNLMECANLNIVFPYIHQKEYVLSKTSNNSYVIEYTSEEIRKAEITDTIVSRLGQSYVIPSANTDESFYQYVQDCIRTGKKPDFIKKTTFVSRSNKDMRTISYVEDDLVSSDFYTHIGFSSKDAFCNIRDAFCTILHLYANALKYCYHCIEIYKLDISATILSGLSLPIIKKRDLKSTVLKVSRVSNRDYDTFYKFFFADKNNLKYMTKAFLPPFWIIGGYIYFSPSISISMLSERNLLKSIKENERYSLEYDYDGRISSMLEPMLVQRASEVFEKHGIKICVGKAMPGSEIDLIAYSPAENTCMLIQAKATLPPEGSKEIRHLSTRVEEACRQLDKFVELPEGQKGKVLSDAFPSLEVDDGVRVIYGVLVNRGFGTYKSYRVMRNKGYVGLNCNILDNVLSDGQGLNNFSVRVSEFVRSKVDDSRVKLLNNYFTFAGVEIKQSNFRIDGSI